MATQFRSRLRPWTPTAHGTRALLFSSEALLDGPAEGQIPNVGQCRAERFFVDQLCFCHASSHTVAMCRVHLCEWEQDFRQVRKTSTTWRAFAFGRRDARITFPRVSSCGKAPGFPRCRHSQPSMFQGPRRAMRDI